MTGPLYQVVHYIGRANEDFVAALLISLALAVILGRTGRERGEPLVAGTPETSVPLNR